MAVPPQVHLFFACADAQVDENNNAVTLWNPIRSLYLPKDVTFPYPCGVIFFYIFLAEGLGKYHCRIEVKDDDGKIVARTKPKTVEFNAGNRSDGVEFIMRFPGFDLPHTGVYEFALCANYVEDPLATVHIRFLERM